MATHPSKPKRGKPFRLHLEIPGELAIFVDEKLAKLQEELPGASLTRSEAVRIALWAWVKTK